jgi:hypothetical protein
MKLFILDNESNLRCWCGDLRETRHMHTTCVSKLHIKFIFFKIEDNRANRTKLTGSLPENVPSKSAQTCGISLWSWETANRNCRFFCRNTSLIMKGRILPLNSHITLSTRFWVHNIIPKTLSDKTLKAWAFNITVQFKASKCVNCTLIAWTKCSRSHLPPDQVAVAVPNKIK